MKKINYLLILIFFLFISCTSSRPKEKKEIRQQDAFIEIVNKGIANIASTKSNNPIKTEIDNKKKKVYINDFFKTTTNFMDSIYVAENWIARVEEVKYEKGDKSSFIFLTFTVKYGGDRIIFNDEITLKSIYTIDNNNKKTDPVFNNLAEINEGNNVCIEGFFNRSLNGRVAIGKTYKTFYFTLINISKNSPVAVAKSQNLKYAINCKFKEMKILGMGILNKKKEKDIKKESMYLNIDSVYQTLTEEEKRYIDKINENYTLNLAREYVDKK
jgi:hypothetical protein